MGWGGAGGSGRLRESLRPARNKATASAPAPATECAQALLPAEGGFCEARNKYFLEATAWHLFRISQQGVGLSLTGRGPSPEACVSSPGVDGVPGHLGGLLGARPDAARLRQWWPSLCSWRLGDRRAAGRSCLPLQLCPEAGPPPAHGFPRAGPLTAATEPRELRGGPALPAAPGGASGQRREPPCVRPSVLPVVRRPPRDCSALLPGPDLTKSWGPGNCTFTQIRFSVVVWVHLEFHSHDTNAPCKLHPLASNRGTPEGQRCQLHTPPPAWQTSTLCLGPDAPQRAVPAYVQLPRPPAVGVRPRRPGPGPRHKVLSSGDPSPWKTPPSHLLCVVPVT